MYMRVLVINGKRVKSEFGYIVPRNSKRYCVKPGQVIKVDRSGGSSC